MRNPPPKTRRKTQQLVTLWMSVLGYACAQIYPWVCMKKRWRVVLQIGGVLGALVAAGCVSTDALYQDFTKSQIADQIPKQWESNFIAGSVQHSWVSALGDASLTALAKELLQNNFALRAQAGRINQRYAQLAAVSGSRLPQFDASFQASRTAANSQLSIEQYTYTSSFTAGLSVAWDADLWGQLGAQARAASYQLEATLAQFQRQRNAQIANLLSLWSGLIVCNQQSDLSRKRIERAKDLLEAATQSYSLGLETLLTVRNQELLLISEKRNHLNQERQCRQSQRALLVHLGRQPSDTLTLPTTLPLLPPTPSAGIPSALLTHRGDLIEARAQLKAAYENIAQARAARFPSLTLSASGSRSSDQIDTVLSSNINTLSIAANLAVPLYAFGRLEAQEDIQRSAAAEAEVLYLQRIYEAMREVEDLLDAEGHLQQSLDLTQKSLLLAEETATIAEQQYTAGVSDFNSWVNAELTYFTNLVTLLQINQERWENRMQLHLALGGSPLPSTDHTGDSPSRL